MCRKDFEYFFLKTMLNSNLEKGSQFHREGQGQKKYNTVKLLLLFVYLCFKFVEKSILICVLVRMDPPQKKPMG